jgi:hypothetical protein
MVVRYPPPLPFSRPCRTPHKSDAEIHYAVPSTNPVAFKVNDVTGLKLKTLVIGAVEACNGSYISH